MYLLCERERERVRVKEQIQSSWVDVNVVLVISENKFLYIETIKLYCKKLKIKFWINHITVLNTCNFV